jgi:catechol-2,3-dioxygenase
MSVTDLELSLEWYSRVFGFRKVEEGERTKRRWVIVRSGDTMICMSERKEWKSDPDEGSRGLHRIWHFGLRVRDAQAWQKTVDDLDLAVEYGGAVDYPNSKSWYITDPSGHEIEVSCWNGDEVRFPEG